MPRYDYRVEIHWMGEWWSITGPRSLGYCQGFMDAREGMAPRPAYRLQRSDGKILSELLPRDEVTTSAHTPSQHICLPR